MAGSLAQVIVRLSRRAELDYVGDTAIDGGRRGTRCLPIDMNGKVVSKSESGPCNLLVVKEVVSRLLDEDAADYGAKSAARRRIRLC